MAEFYLIHGSENSYGQIWSFSWSLPKFIQEARKKFFMSFTFSVIHRITRKSILFSYYHVWRSFNKREILIIEIFVSWYQNTKTCEIYISFWYLKKNAHFETSYKKVLLKNRLVFIVSPSSHSHIEILSTLNVRSTSSDVSEKSIKLSSQLNIAFSYFSTSPSCENWK